MNSHRVSRRQTRFIGRHNAVHTWIEGGTTSKCGGLYPWGILQRNSTHQYRAVKPDAFHSLQDEALWEEFQIALDQEIRLLMRSKWLVTCADLIVLFMVVPAAVWNNNVLFILWFLLLPIVLIGGHTWLYLRNQGMDEYITNICVLYQPRFQVEGYGIEYKAVHTRLPFCVNDSQRDQPMRAIVFPIISMSGNVAPGAEEEEAPVGSAASIQGGSDIPIPIASAVSA
jgi:hypothetical protein